MIEAFDNEEKLTFFHPHLQTFNDGFGKLDMSFGRRPIQRLVGVINTGFRWSRISLVTQ